MAILGGSGGFPPDLMEILMKQDLRLLFVSEEAENIGIKDQLEHLKVDAEIEFINCEREGCWEADIITIFQPEKISSSLVNRIAEVATQKIMLVVSEGNALQDKADLFKLLPNSRVVKIHFDLLANEFSLTGKDTEAKSEVQNILERSGYKCRS